jgi:hypothetical protein
LFADLEARVDQLKASEVDMKNLFDREKDAHEVLEYDYKQLAHECNMHMELRITSDRDQVKPAWSAPFAKKPLSFSVLQKYPPAVGSSLRLSPFPFV